MNLISIAIGPVQDFIAAARRARDLWYGSYLLSEVAKAAARAIREADPAASLIVPFSNNLDFDLAEGSEFTVSNKLLVLSGMEPSALCWSAEQGAKAQIKRAGELGLRGVERKVSIVREIYDRQLETLLEFYAAWVPYSDQQTYQTQRERVELLLAARKCVRDFKPWKGTAGRPKSSHDGFRESVLVESVLVEGSRWKRLFESNLKQGEQLDAIGVIKRFAEPFRANSAPRFNSTADVAAMGYVRRIGGSPEFERFSRFLDDHVHYLNYSLLYEHESRQLFDIDQKDMNENDRAVWDKLKKIRQDVYDEHGRPRPPYFAMLLGDGDNMGKFFGQAAGYEAHQALSDRLSQFAGEAREIVLQHDGCPIYTGGDDVMALLPVNTLCACANELRRAFVPDGSFSAGIVIAHALEPLSDVLRLAREAERRAKRVPQKDAVAITLCPRSGADLEVSGKWPLLKQVDEIAGYYQERSLTLGFAHELRDLEHRTPAELDSVLCELAMVIAGKKKENAKAVELVQKHVRDRESLQRLCGTLLSARPIAAARKEASE